MAIFERQRAIIFGIVSILSSGCITGSILRTDLSDAEVKAWEAHEAAERKRFEHDLQEERRAAASRRVTAPFLWRLSRGGQKGYLLGSMHRGIHWGNSFPRARVFSRCERYCF